MYRLLAALCVLVSLCAGAQAPPPGFVVFTGTRVVDLQGSPANAQICVRLPYSVQPGYGGATTKAPACANVAAGSFRMFLPDGSVSNPKHPCFTASATDNLTGDALLDAGYGCLQTATDGTQAWCTTVAEVWTCNLDNYQPNLPAVAVIQTGPTGSIGPQGFPGVQGPQGVPGQCSTSGSLCPVSLHEAWMSQTECGIYLGADSASGMIYGTNTPKAPATTCVYNWYQNHVSPAWFTILHLDGVVVGPIFGPKQGGWGLVGDSMPGMQVVTINAGGTLSAGVLTLPTPTNSIQVGDHVILQNFASAAFLNNYPLLVTGRTDTQIVSTGFPHADASIDAGIAQKPVGNGIFQAAGANDDAIHNGPAGAGCDSGYSDPGWIHPGPAPLRSSSLLWSGFFVNGNGGDGTHGNSTSGLRQGQGTYQTSYGSAYCSLMGGNIMDMDDVLVENVYFFNSSSYSLRGSNVGRFHTHNVVYSPLGAGATNPGQFNGDGLHIDGPSNDIWSEDDLFETRDDAYCMCSDEGHVGPITRVHIQNPHFNLSSSAGRLITHPDGNPAGNAKPTVSDFLMEGGTGTVNGALYNIGDEGTHTQAALHNMWNIHYRNNDIRGVGTGVAGQAGIKIAENFDDMTFENETYAGLTAAVPYSAFTTYNNSHFSWLNLNNVTVKRDATHYNSKALIDFTTTGQATGGRVSVHNSRIVDTDGGNYGTVQSLISASIASGSTVGVVEASGNEMSNILDVADDEVQFGKITGDGPGKHLMASNILVGASIGGAPSGGGSNLNTISGFDGTHTILFTTGPSPTAGGLLLTTTFSNPRNPASFCVPGGSTNTYTTLSGSSVPVLVSGNPVAYTLYAGATPLAPNTQYGVTINCGK